MKRILYLVPFHPLVPFYCQLSRYLATRGYEAHFVTFLRREHIWLRRNGLHPDPEDIHAVADRPIRDGVLSREEVDDALRFAMGKAGGERAHWEARLLRIASFFDELLAARRFDAVLIWNGQELSGKALAILAGRHGIRTVFAENGYFPDTLQFDLEGINVDSSISRIAFSDLLRARGRGNVVERSARGGFELERIEQPSWRDLARCFLARKLDPAHYRRFPEHLGSTWLSSQWLRLRRALIPADHQPLPGKFIFIAFQVHDDTQILLNSPLFKSMEEFFEASYAAIRRNFGREYAVVVKEHPEDLCRRSYARLRSRYPDVIWLRKYDIDRLLDRAACVFVVNSSVGLQAISRGKPTVVFGDSFYTREEIACTVTDLARIDDAVRAACAGITPERRKNIEGFIGFLNERYFVPASWKRVTAAGVINAGNRILDLIERAAPQRAPEAAVPNHPEREQQACIQQT